MSVFLYKFFHNETNDRTEKGLVKIPKDTDEWPESWKKIVYKHYHLYKPISLTDTKGRLREILGKRRSSEGCLTGNILTLEKIGYMLKCGYGLQDFQKERNRNEHRNVPSAGGRYPLEVYIFLFKGIDDCASGTYHYDVKNHVLEPLMTTEYTRDNIRSFCPQEAVKDSQGMICITSVFERTTEKYGSRGYRYILLEAGHVAQNILLAGAENGVNILPVGGSNEDRIEECLGLGSARERVVYTLFF